MLIVALSRLAITLPIYYYRLKVSILRLMLKRCLLKLKSLIAKYGILVSIILGNDFYLRITIIVYVSRVQLAIILKYILMLC